MTTEEIIKFNKRCAKFLKRNDTLRLWILRENNLELYKGKLSTRKINILHKEPKEKFHSDWNLIIEVVKEIKKLEKDYPLLTDDILTMFLASEKEEVVDKINKFLILYQTNNDKERNTIHKEYVP